MSDNERCDSQQGGYTCCDVKEHWGHHWADLGLRSLRWGVVMTGCADPQCIREVGHDLPHRNGRGMSWGSPLEPLTVEELELMRDRIDAFKADVTPALVVAILELVDAAGSSEEGNPQ